MFALRRAPRRIGENVTRPSGPAARGSRRYAMVVLGALATSACTNVLGLDGYRDALVDAALVAELDDGGSSVGPDGSSAANAEAAAPASARAPDASPPTGCAKDALVLMQAACTTVASFHTTGAVCVAFKVGAVQGWNAANVEGRTATATGASSQGPVTPVNGTIPNQPGLSAGADGYVYFNFSAGSVLYGGMTCW
ncbi:MAG: hypothetical protein JOZ69_10605 [Myxococcales bacterium]|nr:hypothetical protein [Myxococcales bacterium]